MDTDKKKGTPLGNPEYQGEGDPQPAGAGEEGGLGFVGDQRGSVTTDDELPELDVETREGTPITPTRPKGSDGNSKDER